MYNGYTELTELAPEEYLNWQSFDTEGDSYPGNVQRGYAEEQYQKGLEIGRKNDVVFICGNGTWGAERNAPGQNSYTTSYEGIGYHACTKDLLHGFLDSGAPVLVYRHNLSGGVRIK
jgi:hypothetical protein